LNILAERQEDAGGGQWTFRLQHCEQRDCERQRDELCSASFVAGAIMRARLAALAFSIATLVQGQQAVALGDKVEAGCGIANSGSASGNSVTCNFGLTPEQLKQATEAAVKGGPKRNRNILIRSAKRSV
jgi:hypothetical protein